MRLSVAKWSHKNEWEKKRSRSLYCSIVSVSLDKTAKIFGVIKEFETVALRLLNCNWPPCQLLSMSTHRWNRPATSAFAKMFCGRVCDFP